MRSGSATTRRSHQHRGPGLIYDVAHDEAGNVTVKMTLTTQGCPSAQEIPAQVKEKVAAVPDVHDVKVDIVWEPGVGSEPDYA